MRVSVIIKALNEEARIAAAIQSALSALRKLPCLGEVILADSCSTDETLRIAANYPIRVVTLANPDERSCGIGPQLGYQYTTGDFVYILDGDMELDEDFLKAGLEFLMRHPGVAGVGGQVEERVTTSLEYARRARRAKVNMRPGETDRLEMGGLYRCRAIDQVGYFSDRNLRSYEELDLGMRLRARGWRLWRLDCPSVIHHGHADGTLALLLRRWRNGYLCGIGQLLRASVGEPHMRIVLSSVSELRLYLAVLMWWALLVAIPFLPVRPWAATELFAGVLAAPFALAALLRRSVLDAFVTVTSWCFHAAGLVRGFIQARRPPMSAVRSTLVKDFYI
ncbi:glycosyltransferase [Ramlibacter humi]|uniref:Glycosyltransferase n=1 Tax=Ramlibacter humi TaxID=2530451 RepID=A0A4Z0BNL1_9BURK|nr:glycosyltransferase [Ramlibacter humi]